MVRMHNIVACVNLSDDLYGISGSTIMLATFDSGVDNLDLFRIPTVFIA